VSDGYKFVDKHNFVDTKYRPEDAKSAVRPVRMPLVKLATIRNGKPDGELVVVSRDLSQAICVPDLATTMLEALAAWDEIAPAMRERYGLLNAGQMPGAFPFDTSRALAPLPRATQWLDASAFPSHGQRMVQAFGHRDLRPVPSLPLMYQGCPDFLPPEADVVVPDAAYGIDFEGEVAVITADVPMGSSPERCAAAIRLLVLVDDVSLRALQPAEMASGFGMIHSKPASVCSPVCVTPDELGEGWVDGRVAISLTVKLNGVLLGCIPGVEMQYSFGELVAHAAKTRSLGCGTIVGSGTFSCSDASFGSACIAEIRALEKLRSGEMTSGWLGYGDRVRMEALTADGQSVFGAIDHGYLAPQCLDTEPAGALRAGAR
jgi:fumarylacetoacetate (FAA) hydrolase